MLQLYIPDMATWCCFLVSPIDPIIITDLSSDSTEKLMGQDTLPATKIQDSIMQLNTCHLINGC